MHLQIRKVILWPHRPDHAPREVKFELGTLNVISGVSKTGKSAIIPIIDYCLGSEKCSIPVETIRHACSWFGVVLDTADGEVLLARREPGQQKATGQMFMMRAEIIAVPPMIEKPNANIDSVKTFLDELAGLTRLTFDVEGSGSPYQSRPSFRDMTAFLFQPQNIIANANVVFYKADITEYREKLKTIFPYVLGAVTAEVLALQHEQRKLSAELRRKERDLQEMRELSERWVAEIRGKVTRARELGLLAVAPSASASVGDLILLLRGVSEWGDSTPQLAAQNVAAAADDLLALEREEAGVSTELSRLKQRFGDMTRFKEATQEYRGSLALRRDRLALADWLRDLHDREHECPVCGSQNGDTNAHLAELQRALREVEKEADTFSAVPAAFDREYQRVRDEIGRDADRLNAIRRQRVTIQQGSQAARDRQYQIQEAARFAGSLDEALDRYDRVASDSELTAEVTALRERLADIDANLRQREITRATNRALQRFTANAARVLPTLDGEWPNAPLQLALPDLTVKVVRENREDFLWEIGSGANWLAYHIATSVALHELFRALRTSPVPSFVVYDQPSQVYFPRGSTRSKGDSPEPSDEDIQAVRKVFETLAAAVARADGEWQAIVLDHASVNVWGRIKGIHLVEEWRKGEKLVPQAWLD